MRTYDKDHPFPEFKSQAEYDEYVRKTYRAAILTAGAVHQLETEVRAAMMLDGMSLEDALQKYAPDYWQDGYRYCCHDLRQAVRRRIVREQRLARMKARKAAQNVREAQQTAAASEMPAERQPA